MKISCIIVDYNKASQVLENIEGIRTQQGNFEVEVIVWDNSENAENAEILKKNLENQEGIQLVISDTNIGYTKANNKAAMMAKGDYLCFINPDIAWKEDSTLSQLMEYLQENKRVGIIAPRQQEPNGEDALSIRKFPKFFIQIIRRTFLRSIAPFSAWILSDEMKNIDRNQTQTVDWVQSSFLLLEKSFFDQLHGFDEKYFLFLADTQLCKDCWNAGKQVVYYAKTIVLSDGKRCSEGGFFDFFTSKPMQIHLQDSLKYFFT